MPRTAHILLWGALPTLWLAYSMAWARLEGPSSFTQVFANPDEYLSLNFATNPEGLLQKNKASSVMPFEGKWLSPTGQIAVRGIRIKEENAVRYRFDLPDGGAVSARMVASKKRCEPTLQYQRYSNGMKTTAGVLTAGFCP